MDSGFAAENDVSELLHNTNDCLVEYLNPCGGYNKQALVIRNQLLLHNSSKSISIGNKLVRFLEADRKADTMAVISFDRV